MGVGLGFFFSICISCQLHFLPIFLFPDKFPTHNHIGEGIRKGSPNLSLSLPSLETGCERERRARRTETLPFTFCCQQKEKVGANWIGKKLRRIRWISKSLIPLFLSRLFSSESLQMSGVEKKERGLNE